MMFQGLQGIGPGFEPLPLLGLLVPRARLKMTPVTACMQGRQIGASDYRHAPCRPGMGTLLARAGLHDKLF